MDGCIEEVTTISSSPFIVREALIPCLLEDGFMIPRT